MSTHNSLPLLIRSQPMEIIMSDHPETNEPQEEKDPNSETLIVAPPGCRERLQAAQRARANEIRASIELPSHLTRLRDAELDEDVSRASTGTDDKIEDKVPPAH